MDNEARCVTLIQNVHAALETKVAELTATSGPSGPSVSYLGRMLLAILWSSLKWGIFFLLLLTGCLVLGFGVGFIWFGSLTRLAVWCAERWAPVEEQDKKREGHGERIGEEGGAEKKVLQIFVEVLEKCRIEIEELEKMKI